MNRKIRITLEINLSDLPDFWQKHITTTNASADEIASEAAEALVEWTNANNDGLAETMNTEGDDVDQDEAGAALRGTIDIDVVAVEEVQQ